MEHLGNIEKSAPETFPIRMALAWLSTGIVVGTVATQAVLFMLHETQTPQLAHTEIEALMTQVKQEILPEPAREGLVLENANDPVQATLPARSLASQAPAEKLQAPTHLIPARLADMRKKTKLTLRWDAVEGASAYQVKVWQFHDHKQVIVSDKAVPATRLEVEPQFAGEEIHWQVTAVSKSGVLGEPSAPVTLDVMR